MAEPKKVKQTPEVELIDTLDLGSDESAIRFRELVTKFDSAPWDVNVDPPLGGEPTPVIREMWMFGLEIETMGENQHKVKAYTEYALALAKATISVGEIHKAELEDPEQVGPGTYAVVGLGIGHPEQLRTFGPFTNEGYKLFSNKRVLGQILELMTPITCSTNKKRPKPRVILTVEDPEMISNYAFPKSVAEHLTDYTSGLLVEIGEQTLKTLDKVKFPPELERANSRLMLARARRAIAEGLASLKL